MTTNRNNADRAFDLYLDDQDNGDKDLGLTFHIDDVRKYEYNRKVGGVELPCVEYGWEPQRVN